MIDSGAPIGPLDAAAFRHEPQGTARRAGHGPDFRVTLSRALDGPPPELAAEVARASRRWEELQADGRELRFATDPEGGRVTVEVLDADGRVVDTVAPSSALEIAAGAPLP